MNGRSDFLHLLYVYREMNSAHVVKSASRYDGRSVS